MGAIRGAREAGAFRADHAAHLRCEVSAEDCFDVFAELVDEPNVLLVSLMDHTPGQRQFEDVDQFRKYFVGKGMVPESEVETYIEELLREADRHTEANRNRISQSALQQGIAVATHDDATAAHVDEAVQLGVSISEFPTSVAAAEAAVQNGLYVVMGAPNIVRGGSQSGNVAAHELLDRGLLHILSSDYVPASPLQAVFQLVDEGSITLSEGTELVSTNPAKAVGLEDRGQIAVGKRADLIRVREIQVGDRDMSSAKQSMPVVRAVFREGMRVA